MMTKWGPMKPLVYLVQQKETDRLYLLLITLQRSSTTYLSLTRSLLL